MNGLVSMLMPLQTLPGWPPAPDVSVLETMGLLLGIPAVVCVVVLGFAHLHGQAQRSAAPGVGDGPLWLGQGPAASLPAAGGSLALDAGPSVAGAPRAGLDHVAQGRLAKALRNAETASNLPFALYLGSLGDDPRADAERHYGELPDQDSSVLVACDHDTQALEVVTGPIARRSLPDLECWLAAASIRTSFAAGDLVGGLANGIEQLGQAAVVPETLHLRPA